MTAGGPGAVAGRFREAAKGGDQGDEREQDGEGSDQGLPEEQGGRAAEAGEGENEEEQEWHGLTQGRDPC